MAAALSAAAILLWKGVHAMRVNEQFQYLNIGLPDRIARKKTFGDFEGAVRMIDDELAAGKGSPGYQACLRVQR